MDDDENKEREREREREEREYFFPETPNLSFARLLPGKSGRRWEDIIARRFISSRKENKREKEKSSAVSVAKRRARKRRGKGDA